MATCPCVPRRYYHIFLECGRTYISCSHFTLANPKLGLHLFLGSVISFRRNDCQGHGMKLGRLEPPDHTTDAVRNLNPPPTVTELKPLLGLCNTNRRFVQNFACIASPLNKKLKNDEQKMLDSLGRRSTMH